MDSEQLAKIAHDTFHEHAKGPNYPHGLPAPDFNNQPAHIKSAWQKVVERINHGLQSVGDKIADKVLK